MHRKKLEPNQTVRLTCYECDIAYDFITEEELAELKKTWGHISEVQSFEKACKTYDKREDEPPGYSVLDWYTHLGVCPECVQDQVDYDARMQTEREASILPFTPE